MHTHRSAFQLALVQLLLAGCIWPLPIGPAPVTVVTEDVRIATVSDETLFGKTVGASTSTKMVEVVQFDLSSDTDFHQHFKSRFMQVRCNVDGNTDHAWSDFGYGPFYEGTNLSSSNVRESKLTLVPRVRDGRYAYTVYAFAGLSASWLENGHLWRRTHLESLHFSRLSCFIIGVTMAPVVFPQSNEVALSRDQFIALLSARGAATPRNQLIETDLCKRASPACSAAHERP